jgi:hypothetical protein
MFGLLQLYHRGATHAPLIPLSSSFSLNKLILMKRGE